MSTTSLEFLLTATDHASPEFKKLSAQVNKTKDHLIKFGKMAAVAAGVAAVASVKLAADFQSLVVRRCCAHSVASAYKPNSACILSDACDAFARTYTQSAFS